MSFVLDALRKAQSEEAGQHIAAQIRPMQRSSNRPLVWGLVALAVVNIGLASWIFLFNTQAPTATPVGAPSVSTTPSPSPSPSPRNGASDGSPSAASVSQPPQQSVASPRSASTPFEETPVRQATSSSSTTPTVQAKTEAPTPPPVRRVTQPSKPKVVTFAELPASQQSPFKALSISSHIYTDDPSLCAVFIGGTKYKQGDTVNGLGIVEITETGVVFAQDQDGRLRHVAVNIIEDL